MTFSYSLRLGVLLACTVGGPLMAEDWPQWRGPNRDGVWRETGLVDKFAGDELKITLAAADRQRLQRADRGRRPACSSPTASSSPSRSNACIASTRRRASRCGRYSYPCPYVNVGYTAGPRASVTIDEGRAYALGTMGHLHCLDAASGKPLWRKDLNAEYKIRMPIWGIAASPLVDGDLVIVQIGGEEACLVAFDKKTGQERWRHSTITPPIRRRS